MRKVKVLFALICIALMATMTPLASHAEEVTSDYPVAIDVAPNVINLGSSSTWVTVHTDIPYDMVDCGTVALTVLDCGEVPIELCLEDDRGNFVAKFNMNAVKALFETVDNEFTFVLSGATDIDPAVNFSGEQDIRVFDNSEKPGKM